FAITGEFFKSFRDFHFVIEGLRPSGNLPSPGGAAMFALFLNTETITGGSEHFVEQYVLLLAFRKREVDAYGFPGGVKGEFGLDAPHLAFRIGEKGKMEKSGFVNGKAEACNGKESGKKVNLSLG